MSHNDVSVKIAEIKHVLKTNKKEYSNEYLAQCLQIDPDNLRKTIMKPGYNQKSQLRLYPKVVELHRSNFPAQARPWIESLFDEYEKNRFTAELIEFIDLHLNILEDQFTHTIYSQLELARLYQLYGFMLADKSYKYRQTPDLALAEKARDSMAKSIELLSANRKNYEFADYRIARISMAYVASLYNVKEHKILESKSERREFSKKLIELRFIDSLWEINRVTPKDIFPLWNGIISSAVLEDRPALKQFLQKLIAVDKRLRSPNTRLTPSTLAFAEEPILKPYIGLFKEL